MGALSRRNRKRPFNKTGPLTVSLLLFTPLWHSCSAFSTHALFAACIVCFLHFGCFILPPIAPLPVSTMRPTLRTAALGLYASTSVASHLPLRKGPYEFTLEVQGKVSGLVGQLGDGQNRIGTGYPVAEFEYLPPKDGSVGGGVIIDSRGRGCIVTPPHVTQWQCDRGVAGMFLARSFQSFVFPCH
jgi:hypothetical protein